MIRKKKTPRKQIIDLTGPEGNAYVLLGYAGDYAKKLGMDKQKVLDEMTSGNYENLIQVFDKYFGTFVILER